MGDDDWTDEARGGASSAGDDNSSTAYSGTDASPEGQDDWASPPGRGAGSWPGSVGNAVKPPRTGRVKGEDIARYGLDYYTRLEGDNSGNNMDAGGKGANATPAGPSSTQNIVDWTRPPVNYSPAPPGSRSWLLDGLGPIANPVAGLGNGADGIGAGAGMADGNNATGGSNRKNSWDEAIANAAAAFPGFLLKGSPKSSAPSTQGAAAPATARPADASFPASIPGLESATDSNAPLSPPLPGIPGLEATSDQTPSRTPSDDSAASVPFSAPSGGSGAPTTPSTGASPTTPPPGSPPPSPPAASYRLV